MGTDLNFHVPQQLPGEDGSDEEADAVDAEEDGRVQGRGGARVWVARVLAAVHLGTGTSVTVSTTKDGSC